MTPASKSASIARMLSASSLLVTGLPPPVVTTPRGRLPGAEAGRRVNTAGSRCARRSPTSPAATAAPPLGSRPDRPTRPTSAPHTRGCHSRRRYPASRIAIAPVASTPGRNAHPQSRTFSRPMCQIQLPKRGLSTARAPRGAMTKIESRVQIVVAIRNSSHGASQPIKLCAHCATWRSKDRRTEDVNVSAWGS
jgi:hypothetical protein